MNISIGHNGNVATIYNVGKIIKSVSPSANLIAVVGSTAPGETLYNNIPQKQGGVNGQNSFGRGFDEMAAEAKTPFEKGEAEGVSAEVTDSEKRVCKNAYIYG